MTYNILKPWLDKLGYTEETLNIIANPPKENDYHLLSDNEATCKKLISLANEGGHHVVVVGDYDADGVTATSILLLALQKIGLTVDYYIPHRVKDGYGLSVGIIDKVLDKWSDVDVFMTCDNGIAAKSAVDYAKEKGMFVIVTDHHSVNPEFYPDKADLIVHPGHKDSYPFRNISGAQVAWKISQELFELASVHDEALENYLFQLMTVSIVSDVMPVASTDIEEMKHNENRYLLSQGIESLRTRPDIHWKYIFKAMNIDPSTIDETTIGFYIAPAINATGRLVTAEVALKALTAKDEKSLQMYSSMMVYYNTCRKEMKYELLEETKNMVDDSKPIIILRYKMPEGLVGIIAGNYADRYKRPCFVFAPTEVDGKKAWKGSARSPECCDWNCFENLCLTQEKTESILKFGGHAGAAGLTVMDDDFTTFENALIATAKDIDINNDMSSIFDIELPVNAFSGLKDEIVSLKPFGNGLPKPVIKTQGKIWRIDMFFKSNHVKLSLEGGQEIWLYGELQSFLAKNDIKRYYDLIKSNEDKKGKEERWEFWMLKKGRSLQWEIIAEYDYGTVMDAVGLIPGNARVKQIPEN